jgi:mRNA-degrading endonuclease RelE of RelBE toxin-antitoxin system
MRFEIILAPEAVADLNRLSAYHRAWVRHAMETHLRYEPTKVSKSRIKRLRERSHPKYRLRVGELRIFYDVVAGEVQVLAIVAKSDVDSWLAEVDKRDEDGTPIGSEG